MIGGGRVYEEMLPYCNVAHVTKIDFAFEADTHFPNLDADPAWEITASSDEQTYFDLELYLRKIREKVKIQKVTGRTRRTVGQHGKKRLAGSEK